MMMVAIVTGCLDHGERYRDSFIDSMPADCEEDE